MKNILIIHHGKGVGGGLIALIGLIEELKVANKIDVLSIFDGVAVQYLRQTGVNVIIPKSKFYLKYYEIFVHSAASYFSIIDFIKKVKSFFLYILSKYCFAKKELKELPFQYDVVYLNSTFISDWALAAKSLNKKVVIHVREPLADGSLNIGRLIIRNTIKEYCDSIIAITQDNSQRVNLPYKTTVIYDPVVKTFRQLAEGMEDIKIDASLKYFLYLGGMVRIKGFEQLVNSLDFLRDDIRIFFLGPEVHYQSRTLKHRISRFIEPYRGKHEYLVQRMIASPKIVYVGETDHVFLYYKKSIALISPFSKPHAALPILEAFSLGVPVIVSDIKGMDELVDGRNGYFFKNNDPISLANRINEMASLSEAEYEAMKEASQKTYRRIRSNSNTISSIIEKL